MSTDDDKIKTAKLLEGLEVPDIKLSERCSGLIKDFHEKYDKEIENEETEMAKLIEDDVFENPYKVDQALLEENEKKLTEVLMDIKRTKKALKERTITSDTDPKRPWRTHSHKERLLRINNELKHHHEKGSHQICPLDDNAMRSLVQECEEETKVMAKVTPNKLRETIDDAKKSLPNFQYRKVDNSTAIMILPSAHEITSENKVGIVANQLDDEVQSS